MLNDTFANDPKITQRLGPAEIALNPADASRRGLTDGDRVAVANDVRHAAARPAPVRRRAARRCAIAQRPLAQARVERANVNVLNPGIKSDMGQSSAVHGIEVTVTAAS